jgi:hypothetical protein
LFAANPTESPGAAGEFGLVQPVQKQGEPAMTTANNQQRQTLIHDLSQVIEPLASYICAADRPRETLLSVLTKLFDEVEGTHKATLMHIAALRADSLGLAS